MATLTRYETFEELKADRPVISGDLLAERLKNKDKEAKEFYELLAKYRDNCVSNLIIQDETK